MVDEEEVQGTGGRTAHALGYRRLDEEVNVRRRRGGGPPASDAGSPRNDQRPVYDASAGCAPISSYKPDRSVTDVP
jgi:hypothetical protein